MNPTSRRTSHKHHRSTGKLKLPADDGEEDTNPINLELIDLRAALIFNNTRLLAFNDNGQVIFVDKQGDELETLADPQHYRWDWNLKLFDPVFKHLFWIGCDTASVQIDPDNHTLRLVIARDESLAESLNEDFRPAIMMVEPWSGHLHVFNHHLKFPEEQWLKLCDVKGVTILVPPLSRLLQDPDVIPVTLTRLAFCTGDPKLTFTKRVKKLSKVVGQAILNDVTPRHSNIHELD